MANTIQNTLFEIPKDGYLAFDALSMKQLINENLNKNGVFTDQNYEGSYLSNIINIIAYSYNALMFYLNKTSTESMFTEAQIYENMNRIVKMLGYNPIGFQTSILPFTLEAININKGLYVIPRYSYFIKNGISYSFNEDIIFNKTLDNETETLSDISLNKVLYQGRFYEHPPYTATGEDNEIFTLSVDRNIIIDHFNIFVYRYNTTDQIWEQWSSTDNLFLESPSTKKYEIRLNSEQNYEIKFGNNINGLKLNPNDLIAIYYLQSDGVNGEINTGELNNATYVRFFTDQFNKIYNDLRPTSAQLLLDDNNIRITNTMPSTKSKNGETVDEIRESAPALFRTQYRLVTSKDYKTYIMNNFANFIQDVNVSNNWEYIANRLKYYYDLGLMNPDRENGPLYAQVNFADSCNFNNIYITVVPKTSIASMDVLANLSVSQKQVIIDSLESRKILTTEIVIVDPVYVAVNVGLAYDSTNIDIDDIEDTSIVVTKTSTSRRTDDDIKADIVEVFEETFNRNNLKLGQTINLIELTSKILSIQGIKEIYTKNNKSGIQVPGLTFYVFDPIYPSYVNVSTSQIKLKDFEFLYFNNLQDLVNRITVQQSPTIYEKVEF